MSKKGPMELQAWYRPNWREEQARDYTLEAADMYVERYRYFLRNPDECTDDPVRAAHAISVQAWKRGQVEAYLMAGATPEDICDRAYLHIDSVRMYEKLFCDLEPLRTKQMSLTEACFDQSASRDLCRLRLFGLRYGKVFLDWVISKIKILSQEDFELIELRLRSILLMRAVEADMVRLSDKDRVDTLLKVISSLGKYKTTLRAVDARSDLDNVLDQLKGLVENATPPGGLPRDVLEYEMALPSRGKSEG